LPLLWRNRESSLSSNLCQ